MIPSSPQTLSEEKNNETPNILPTKTYRIDPVNKRIIGTIEGPEAVMQFIQKVMSTDKYAFEIYDWYYGNELFKLVGHSYDYVATRIPNIFREALLVDDRILDVRDFTFTRSEVDTVVVSCTVDTVYGQIKYEQEVLT
jgi:hypothetical protein